MQTTVFSQNRQLRYSHWIIQRDASDIKMMKKRLYCFYSMFFFKLDIYLLFSANQPKPLTGLTYMHGCFILLPYKAM